MALSAMAEARSAARMASWFITARAASMTTVGGKSAKLGFWRCEALHVWRSAAVIHGNLALALPMICRASEMRRMLLALALT